MFDYQTRNKDHNPYNLTISRVLSIINPYKSKENQYRNKHRFDVNGCSDMKLSLWFVLVYINCKIIYTFYKIVHLFIKK